MLIVENTLLSDAIFGTLLNKGELISPISTLKKMVGRSQYSLFSLLKYNDMYLALSITFKIWCCMKKVEDFDYRYSLYFFFKLFRWNFPYVHMALKMPTRKMIQNVSGILSLLFR